MRCARCRRFPAQRIGLADRGVLREGMKADIAIFDAAKVRDTATFERPHQYAEGVTWVIVNGQVAFENGTMTPARPGRILFGASHARNMAIAAYSVERGAPAAAAPVVPRAAAEMPPRPAAVLVVHGMGGQLQFQTLTDIADGLREASLRCGGTPSDIVARAIGVGDERLERLELTVSDGTTTRPVHVYEAYWAPLTEGQVTLRDVIRFLFRAGVDGLWHSALFLPFKRFLDQRYVTFPVPVRTPLLLLAALMVALSLVIMNVSIVGLAAMRSPLKIAPDWATASLFRDVTAILDLFVAAAVGFGAALLPSLAWRRWLTRAATRDWRRRVRARTGKEPRRVAAGTLIAGLPAILAFVVLLAATVVAGVAMPLVIYFHTTQARTDETGVSVLDLALSAPVVDAWLRSTAMLLIALTAIAIAAIAIVFALRVVRGLGGTLRAEGSGRSFWLTLSVAAAVAAIIAAGAAAAWLLVPHIPQGDWFDVSGEGGLSIVWLLAIGVSALARHFLVAYVGDVAVYVQPQELDRFNTLRMRIRDCVWRSARAVFQSPEAYDEVIVVGHSLRFSDRLRRPQPALPRGRARHRAAGRVAQQAVRDLRQPAG